MHVVQKIQAREMWGPHYFQMNEVRRASPWAGWLEFWKSGPTIQTHPGPDCSGRQVPAPGIYIPGGTIMQSVSPFRGQPSSGGNWAALDSDENVFRSLRFGLFFRAAGFSCPNQYSFLPFRMTLFGFVPLCVFINLTWDLLTLPELTLTEWTISI